MKIRNLFAAAGLAMALSVSAAKPTIGVIVYNLDSIDQKFSELKEQGFGSCEINWNSRMCTPELAKKVKAASEATGIKVTTILGVPGSGHWNFTQGPATIGIVPPEGREAKIAELKKMIDFAQQAGITAMHTHFGFIPEDPNSELYKEFIVNARKLAEYAKERGRDIYFETGQETPIALVRALKDIGTGNVFVNCDTGNLLLYGKANPVDAIRMFGPYLRELHAKDGFYPTPEDPDHLGREVPIPYGMVNFPAVIDQLKVIGFEGAITIECELGGAQRDYALRTRIYLQGLLDR